MDRKYKTFKQLVTMLSEAKTRESIDIVCSEIDLSFQNDKITWQDNKTLYNLINIYYNAI